ncbi:hypothetical protein GCM10023156_49110 [Novipirellula rosea]|uniref:Uncharacterized protein n=1 Tax=Novipirellula rosea TaxID=1031540 RepID=A0ABP8NDN6_9BACT
MQLRNRMQVLRNRKLAQHIRKPTCCDRTGHNRVSCRTKELRNRKRVLHNRKPELRSRRHKRVLRNRMLARHSGRRAACGHP